MNINANTDAGVRVFQPLPDDLSKAEQIDHTIGALVADMRFALLEVSKLREDNHAMRQLLDAGKAQQILVSPATPSTVIMNTSSPPSSAISSCNSAMLSNIESERVAPTVDSGQDPPPPLSVGKLDLSAVPQEKRTGAKEKILHSTISKPSTRNSTCQTPAKWMDIEPVPRHAKGTVQTMMQAIRPKSESSSASKVAPNFPVPIPEPKPNKRAGKASGQASGKHVVRADTECGNVSGHKWTCLHDCGFNNSSWSKVDKHEAHCPAATGPRPSLLKAEHDDDSGFETAPESAASPAGGTEIQAGRPDRARRMQRMLRRREVAWRSSLVLLIFFGLWRGVRRAGAAVRAHDDDISSVGSSGSRRRGRRGGRHRKSKVSRARSGRPPDRPDYGSDASNEERKGALGFNKDFPYINARAACIKCGDGWMPGYWHRGVRVNQRGFTRIYDPLADKIMCDHCRNKYPLGPYYFPVYEPIVTEAATARIVAENQPDYIDPAQQSAACFEKYRVQECKEFAAERAAKDVDKEIDGPLPTDVAPAHNVPMRVLTTIVNSVCSDFEQQRVYAQQHKWALAAVGPVLDNILCNAEHIGMREVGRRSSSHWDLEVAAPVPAEHRQFRGVYLRQVIPNLALELFKRMYYY